MILATQKNKSADASANQWLDEGFFNEISFESSNATLVKLSEKYATGAKKLGETINQEQFTFLIQGIRDDLLLEILTYWGNDGVVMQ